MWYLKQRWSDWLLKFRKLLNGAPIDELDILKTSHVKYFPGSVLAAQGRPLTQLLVQLDKLLLADRQAIAGTVDNTYFRHLLIDVEQVLDLFVRKETLLGDISGNTCQQTLFHVLYYA